MAQFDYNNTIHGRFFTEEGRTILNQTLADPNMIRSNHQFFREDFEIDPYTIPVAHDGTATFRVNSEPSETGQLMDLRAPMGDTDTRDVKPGEYYTGSMPDFSAKGFVETALERDYKEKAIADGTDNDMHIAAQYVDKVLNVGVDSGYQTLSHMSAYVQSRGELVYTGGDGASAPVYKTAMPEANFSKAGKTANSVVWTADNCKLITQMVEIEKYYQDLWGLELAMQWDIPYDLFQNVVLKNAEVIDWARQNLYYKGIPALDNLIVQKNDAIEYLSKYEGLSPIRVVSEKQYDKEKVVSGWKPNVAVLRPRGVMGKIFKKSILDTEIYKKYGAAGQTRVFGTTADGLITVMNTTLDNGNLKEWHTDILMSAVPVLTDFEYRVIVDTASAD